MQLHLLNPLDAEDCVEVVEIRHPKDSHYTHERRNSTVNPQFRKYLISSKVYSVFQIQPTTIPGSTPSVRWRVISKTVIW